MTVFPLKVVKHVSLPVKKLEAAFGKLAMRSDQKITISPFSQVFCSSSADLSLIEAF